MNNIQKDIGAKIRMYRKLKQYTLEDLSSKIYKGKSILSKYELGEATIDISTLYEIADVLGVSVKQLLGDESVKPETFTTARYGVFNNQALYIYLMVQSKSSKLLRGYLTFSDEPNGRVSATLYLGVSDFENYRNCISIHTGELSCYPTNAVIHLVNHIDPADHTVIFAGIHMCSPNTCYGMLMQNGYTTSDPGAFKIIMSKYPMTEGPELNDILTITKDDATYMRRSNVFGYHTDVISDRIFFLQNNS